MIKRTAVLIGALALCVVMGATSYSRAHVHNDANLRIVRSQDALIAIDPGGFATEGVAHVSQGDDSNQLLVIKPNPSSATVRITNNSADDIQITSIQCAKVACESLYSYQYERTLLSGCAQDILITLWCNEDDLKRLVTDFVLKATWQGGEAAITFTVTPPPPAQIS